MQSAVAELGVNRVALRGVQVGEPGIRRPDAELAAQLREAGLDPVIERERDRRISQGLDLYVGRPRGVISMEEWDKTLDEL